MSLGPDTGVVNGQRNTFPTSDSFRPMSYGVQSSGVPIVSPSIPPFIGGSPASGGSVGVGGYGTADNNAAVTQIAAQYPYNLKVSPVWWAVAALVGGLVLLKAIHWRETIAEEGRVGPLGEKASESA